MFDDKIPGSDTDDVGKLEVLQDEITDVTKSEVPKVSDVIIDDVMESNGYPSSDTNIETSG